RQWDFQPKVAVGAKVSQGDILGTVQESSVVEHRIMVPYRMSGTVKRIHTGTARLEDEICVLVDEAGQEHSLTMLQKWPVRRGRPYQEKMAPGAPMVTGQRVIDTLFPIASGGVAAVPGPFGSGKTVVQHQLAKWADADIIV